MSYPYRNNFEIHIDIKYYHQQNNFAKKVWFHLLGWKFYGRLQIKKKIQKRRIGLLGGSFNPPHLGHLHISNQAIKIIGLNEVWWIISPKNPLKTDYSFNYTKRLEACRKLLNKSNIKLSEVEKITGSYYSSETIKILKKKYPRVQFVWLIGADNMHSFHKWEKWDDIFIELPIAIFARPNNQLKAGLSLAAQKYFNKRVHSRNLLNGANPRWSMQIGPQVNMSSTQLRADN